MGGHTVSIRGYSLDFHVDLHTVFDYCDKKSLI